MSRLMDKQMKNQMNGESSRQRKTQLCRKIGGQVNESNVGPKKLRQVNKQTGKVKVRKKDGQLDRLTDGVNQQTTRQTDRQTDDQTDGQTIV